jgi:hypothetical protein
MRVRMVVLFGTCTVDEFHFAEAAAPARVLLSHDTDMLTIAVRWQSAGLG